MSGVGYRIITQWTWLKQGEGVRTGRPLCPLGRMLTLFLCALSGGRFLRGAALVRGARPTPRGSAGNRVMPGRTMTTSRRARWRRIPAHFAVGAEAARPGRDLRPIED